MGNHHYLWDKKKQFSSSAMEYQKRCFNSQTMEGIAYQDNKKTGSDKTDAIKTANDYFNNDSFYIVLQIKLRDPGTSRSIVMQDEKEALMVTYTSGGSTPGTLMYGF
jgi:hypothetical protein